MLIKRMCHISPAEEELVLCACPHFHMPRAAEKIDPWRFLEEPVHLAAIHDDAEHAILLDDEEGFNFTFSLPPNRENPAGEPFPAKSKIRRPISGKDFIFVKPRHGLLHQPFL